MSYEGLSDESTLILPFAAYLGMFGVVLFPESFFSGVRNSKSKSSVADSSLPGSEENMRMLDSLTSTTSTTSTPPTTPDGNPEVTGTGNSSAVRKREHAENDEENNAIHQHEERVKTRAAGTIGGSPMPAICLKLGVKGLLALMVFADFTGMVLSILGMQLCGSGLHTVVMSSIVCWAAILSFFVLNKRIDGVEGGSLAVIMMGLMMAAGAQQRSKGVVEMAKEIHGTEVEDGRGEIGGERSEARESGDVRHSTTYRLAPRPISPPY